MTDTSPTLTEAEQTALDRLRAETHVIVPTGNPEVQYYADLYYALLDALREFPDLPPSNVLVRLRGNFPEDWKRGKGMQMEIGLQKIPPKTEAEIGAGFWDRITGGKWRDSIKEAQASE